LAGRVKALRRQLRSARIKIPRTRLIYTETAAFLDPQ
jgi:hypothetical protein